MEWSSYIIAFVIALLITASAVFALRWAVKSGQFRDFEKGAETIFDEDEPMGRPQDSFPGKPPPAKPILPNR
jgi:cbb3-type cytochrome oxidase maturation protein